MSTLGDLTNRVRRFGKCPNTVPGTYMSAAGVQTEIHPTTLARLAVHETYYRRKVHVYQQDLENTVHKIQKDQIVMKRSYGEYKRKLSHNQKNKYISPFYSASRDSNLSNSTWSTTSEVLPGEVKVVRRGGKKVRIILSPLENKVSGVGKSGEMKGESGKSENQSKTQNSSTQGKSRETGEETPSKVHLQNTLSSSSLVTEELTEVTDQSSENFKQKGEVMLCKMSGEKQRELKKRRKSKKGKKTDQEHLTRSKVDFEETVTVLQPPTPEVQETKQTQRDIETEAVKASGEKVESVSFVTHKDAVVSVIDKSKPPEKHTASKPSDTDTSAFMELVRMKNKYGLVKNMKVVDELIQHSKNRSFAYLTKVSESKENLLREQDEGEDNSSEEQLGLVSDGPVFQDRANPVFEGTDEVDNDIEGSISVSDVMSLDDYATKPTNEPPKRNRKPNTIVAPDIAKLPYIQRDGTNFSLFASRNPSQLLPGRSQVDEVPISRRVSLPSRKVDKFLKDEKAKTSNYKSDVSWQQSLASIKDVHYIRNKNDFQNFAKSILEKDD